MVDTIPAILRAAAEQYDDKPAYVDGDRVVSFAELLALVQATARGYASLGLSAGDRLVIWAPNSINWVVAALATSYAGGTLIPANSRYTAHEVADLIERTDAKIVVLADGFLDRTQLADLRPLVPGRTLIDITTLPSSDSPEDDVEARADAVTPDDVADILFTSGTTGKPKGAMSAHRQTIGVAAAWAEVAGIRPDDRYLVVNPFFHSFGYKIGIVVGLLTGSTLYPVATFDLDETMSLIERARITVFPGAPAIFQSMLTVDRSGHDLSSLRLAVTGAAMIPVVLIERMRDELGFDDVLTAFGMTEAVVVTMCRQGDDAETIANTSGRAVPGMTAKIHGGVEGELLVKGDNVMLGYLDDPDATAAAIDAEGWLHTGDVGVLDEAGNLKITDRLKDMYISGGFNVYPAEVEQTLLRAEGVQDVAVIGVPDERMGEVGKAFVVGTATDDDLLAFAKERLANFKIPRHIERIDVLPRNLSGKVLKNELRSR